MKTSSRTRAREGTTPRAAEQSEGQVLLSAAAERLVDVAERLHVGVSTVSDWRRGAKSPGGHARKRLAEVYGIPPESWDRPARSLMPGEVGGDRLRRLAGELDDAPAHVPMELDTDGPPLESTLRMLDQQLMRLANGGTDEDFKQAEGIRKMLATRAQQETSKRTLDAYIERSLINPTRQPFYQRVVNMVVDALKPYPDALRDVLAALDAAAEEGDA